jgi:hypothetical protein
MEVSQVSAVGGWRAKVIVPAWALLFASFFQVVASCVSGE